MVIISDTHVSLSLVVWGLIFSNAVHYRSWSMPMSTTWRHFTRSRPTKKHICTPLPIALIMMSLLWTRTAGQRTVWICSRANFKTLDRETEWALEGYSKYWHDMRYHHKTWCWDMKEAVCRIVSFIYHCEINGGNICRVIGFHVFDVSLSSKKAFYSNL